jgi:nucleotide-binding universal stress UspA family protein
VKDGLKLFENVVVGAVDSEAAAHAVQQAIEVTKASGGTLHIVTAFKANRPHPPEMPEEFRYSSPSFDPVDLLLNKLKATANQVSVRVTTNPVLSDPVDAIIRVAEQENADLIVVGVKRSHGARHMSHVTKIVMDKAACAVLVV